MPINHRALGRTEAKPEVIPDNQKYLSDTYSMNFLCYLHLYSVINDLCIDY